VIRETGRKRISLHPHAYGAGSCLACAAHELPSPAGTRLVGAFSLGRDALWWIAVRVAEVVRDVWLPEYCCAQVVEVFSRAGLRLHSYPLSADLTVDWEMMAALSKSMPRSVLVLVDLLGYPCVAAAEHEQTLDSSFICVVRDCAQAVPSEGTRVVRGQEEGFIVYSLRKPFPIPDYAVVYGLPDSCVAQECNSNVPSGSVSATLSRRAYARLEEFLLRRPGYRRAVGVRAARQLLKRSALRGQQPSRLSSRLIGLVDAQASAQARRENAALLLNELREIALWKSVPTISSPYCFPVLVDNAAAAKARLHRHGIEATTLWGVRGLWDKENSSSAETSVRRLLCLPVHQDLSKEEIEMVCSVGGRILG